MMKNMYLYRATVVDVYDGDTITVDVDLGLHVWRHRMRVRLYGVDAPEVRGDEAVDGVRSRNWLADKVLGEDVLLETVKDRKGKYGRWLGVLWLKRDTINAVNVNKLMIDKGFAREYGE